MEHRSVSSKIRVFIHYHTQARNNMASSSTLQWVADHYDPDSKFLGITYDRQLTFGLHASIVGSKMKLEAGGLRYLALTDWGYQKSTIRSTYVATGRSTVECAAAAWLPWVSLSTMERLEMCQRYAGGAITGQLKMTPAEVILVEADLPNVAIRATQLSVIAMEKSLRMPDANPRGRIAIAIVRQRTKKTSWRKTASEVRRSIFGSTQPERSPGLLPPC